MALSAVSHCALPMMTKAPSLSSKVTSADVHAAAAHGRTMATTMQGKLALPLRSSVWGRQMAMPQQLASLAVPCKASPTRMMGDPKDWKEVPSGDLRFKTISCGDERTIVGTDASENVYLFNGSTWDKTPGAATQVSVGLSGMFAVSKANKLYKWEAGLRDWVEFKTNKGVTQVTSGQDVYIIDTDRDLFKYQGDGKWFQIESKWDFIETNDYGDLWGIQIGELKRMHRRLYGGWTFVPGPNNRDNLKQVSTGINGVWAVDDRNKIFRWVTNTRNEGAWVQLEGELKTISAGFPVVVGLDTNGKVYKYSVDYADSANTGRSSAVTTPMGPPPPVTA